jgi:hypothetical protein
MQYMDTWYKCAHSIYNLKKVDFLSVGAHFLKKEKGDLVGRCNGSRKGQQEMRITKNKNP